MSQERHLLEYLYHRLEYDPAAGLRDWARAFDQALRNWDGERCHLLLAEMRRGDVARVSTLCRSAPEVWKQSDTRGLMEEAIKALEQSIVSLQDS